MTRRMDQFSDGEMTRMELSSAFVKSTRLTRTMNGLPPETMVDATIITAILLGSGLKTTTKDGEKMAPKVDRDISIDDSAAVIEKCLEMLVKAKKVLGPIFEEYYQFSFEQITGETYGR
jgi:hypothetical protein